MIGGPLQEEGLTREWVGLLHLWLQLCVQVDTVEAVILLFYKKFVEQCKVGVFSYICLKIGNIMLLRTNSAVH